MARYKPQRREALLFGRLPDGSQYPTARQPAVSTACDFCRRRKIRCNGDKPCDKCQQHNRANTCHFQDPSSKPKRAAPLHKAKDRIRELEDQLASIERSNGPSSDSSLQSQSHASVRDTSWALNASARTAASSHTAGDTNQEVSHEACTSPSSPTSSAVASIIADLGNPRHTAAINNRADSSRLNSPRSVAHVSSGQASAVASASPSQHGPRVMSNLRVNNRGESRYHGPTSASFSLGVIGANSSNVPDENRRQQQQISLDPALLTDQLTSLAARERQQEVMNVVAGRLDFDGVEPELALHLLNLHWNRQHHAYLVTYRPLFMRDMAAPPGKAKYFSKLLFHAILFGAAKFSDRIEQVRSDINDPSTAGMQFLERVQQLLPEALIKSRITTVQALLLLACTHYARGSESAAWLHSGLAFRMAVDLGMNEDSIELIASGNMALEELELRRRVVWAAFVIDKIHSLYQGRQASIERRNLYVPIEFYDQFEETEFWTPIAYHRPSSEFEAQDSIRSIGATPTGYTGPIYSVSTFAELCKLTVLMEKIIQVFYSIDSGARTERAQTEHLIEMRSELAGWRTALPSHLRIDSAGRSVGPRSRTCPPNLISLHALYHALTILLNRPFLPHGHLRSDDAASGRSAWKACVDAASSISSLMNLYRQTVSMKGAPQLISYINFCAAGIHVRVAAQLQQSNTSGEGANTAAAASSRRYELKALRQCLQDFEENQDPNPGVVKAKSVIRNMAERAGILDLLHDGPGEGGLSPINQDESPPLITTAGNDSAATTSGHDGAAGNPAMRQSNAVAITTSTSANAGAGTALRRANAVDNSVLGLTPPYEIDFESILASFDQFEAGRDGLFPATADANTNSDMLFGFLRDYDVPSALSS